MRGKTQDLHGNAPDNAAVALLLIDVINDLEFPEGDDLFRLALPMARYLQELKQACQELDIPCIYVNDNFGKWRSDLNAQVQHCLEDKVRGEPIVRLLRPSSEDYFVLKPKHSGFFTTTLDLLLEHLESKRLILTGVATNICVLFTANDAVSVPRTPVQSRRHTVRLSNKVLKLPFERERSCKVVQRPTREVGWAEARRERVSSYRQRAR